MIIPKTLKNNLVSTTEEEIKAYYSLTCVRDADYDFTEQINKILTEYMTFGINIPNDETGNKKRLYKSQLKKMILVDRPKNSKKFDVFNQWRLARINFYKNRRKDQFIEMKNIDVSPIHDEKDKIIEKLMKENKELKQRLKQYETKPIMRTIETQTETETETETENPKSYYEEDDGYLEDTDEESEEEDTAEESEEEDTDEESEEEDTDEETPKITKITNPQQKRHCIQKFNEVCKSKMKPYLDQYEKEKENMNQKQIEQLQKQIRDKYVSEIVEPERDNFDRFVELSFKEYNELVYKPADKIMDEMLYQ